MQKSSWLWGFILATSACTPLGSGCAADCTQMRKDYATALSAESPFATPTEASDELPIHFGIAIRDHLLNEVVDRAMRAGLEKALSFTDAVSMATGQKIGLTTKGEVADLGLYPDKACEECLRVDGRLGGSLTVKLPVLGAQRVPLSGAFSIVAPVKFAQTSDGRAALQLDLAQAAELGKSHVNPEVTQLPPTWWKAIEAPLSRLMAKAVTQDLPAVTLFTFKGFDLGIDGLNVTPARIVSDAKHGVVFAGFTTNLAVEGAALEPRTDLGKNDDLAVGIDRRLLGAMSVALLKSGKLSRTWTKDGKEDPAGPIAITMPTVRIADQTADGKQPYEMTFRAWDVPAEGKCWWAQARASGTVEMGERSTVRVAIDDVKLIDSSLPGVFRAVANWSTSRLIAESAQLVTRTLTMDAVEFPGGAVVLDKSRLALASNGLWLSGSAAVKDKAAEGDGEGADE